jgi:site-specific DNA recombinase
MNALFLKDLADKTHRGLRGRVEDGRSAGGLCYGYRVVKSLTGSAVTTGEREIEPSEAAIVERIPEYVAGIVPVPALRMSKCGVCGAGFIMAGRNRLACFGAREKGTCDNRLTIRREASQPRHARSNGSTLDARS